jgi:hypothetical protein
MDPGSGSGSESRGMDPRIRIHPQNVMDPQHCSGKGWRRLPEDVKTHVPLQVNVGMIDFCLTFHLNTRQKTTVSD